MILFPNEQWHAHYKSFFLIKLVFPPSFIYQPLLLVEFDLLRETVNVHTYSIIQSFH